MTDPSSEAAVKLARRLRALRLGTFDSTVTQQILAKALSADQHIGAAAISTWERTREPVLPPAPRLRSYARFFATPRSLRPEPHLLDDAELTDDERRERDRLERELLGLRDAVLGPADQDDVALRRSWQFEDSGPLTIICPDLPADERHPMRSPADPNFTELLNYADADALVELHGHVRAENPAMEVSFSRASHIAPDDLSGHVVLIGGIGWNPVTRRIQQRLELPIRQVVDERVPTGEVFEVEVDGAWQRRLPRWSTDEPAELVEDVGLFVRMPNPMNSRRTLTLCNGIHSRGVLGAVRTLTDPRMRDANEDFLATRFGDRTAFGVLMRITVVEGRVMTPDLNQRDTRLYEWSQA